jgi:hypothetical protein
VSAPAVAHCHMITLSVVDRELLWLRRFERRQQAQEVHARPRSLTQAAADPPAAASESPSGCEPEGRTLTTSPATAARSCLSQAFSGWQLEGGPVEQLANYPPPSDSGPAGE